MQAHTKQETGIQSLLWSPYHHEANLSLWYSPGNGLISPLLLDQPRNTGKKWKSLLVSLRKSLKMATTDLTQRLKANAMIRGKNNNNNKAANLHVHDTCITIAHVRYIKILTWLRGFRVIFRYLVWFSLCSSLFWELRDNGVVKNVQSWP